MESIGHIMLSLVIIVYIPSHFYQILDTKFYWEIENNFEKLNKLVQCSTFLVTFEQ